MNSGNPLRDIDDTIQEMMAEWKVPGIAVAVIKDGEIILNRGYGLRDIEKKLPMTENTLLAVGSCTKAFTATAIAMLVDEGVLGWDKPVRHYLPTFGMDDPVANERLTVRDLLCHRCGLPGHDFLWYNTAHFLSRKALVERIRYLQPSKGFRAEFQYQNIIYAAAGYLVGQVTGGTWEAFVQKRIFDPLGMKTSNFSVEGLPQVDDASLGYELKEGEIALMPYANIDNLGPAGSINASVNEMARWVLLQLDKGKYSDMQLVSEANLEEVHTPHTVINDPIRKRIYGLNLAAYALGWVVQPYRGHTLLWHSGGIDGFIANVSFMPEIDAGVVVLSNLNINRIVPAIAYTIYDRLRGLADDDWSARFKQIGDELDAEELEIEAKFDDARIDGTQLSHPLKDYCGVFENPGYGVLTVAQTGESLSQTYNDRTNAMKHYHYDTFETVCEIEMRRHRKPMTYVTDATGSVVSVAIPFEPLLPPIVFTRIGKG